MDLTAWAYYALIALIALGAVLLHYRRREPAGRGRIALALLRWLVVALVLLLLFDPAAPALTAGRDGAAASTVLVDASLSMRLPDEQGRTRWDVALGAAAEIGSTRVLLFGAGEARPLRERRAGSPDAPASRLAPAVRAAAEAGSRRVVVLTDAGIEDRDEVLRLVRSTGIDLDVRRVGGEAAGNAGIVDLEAPPWVEVGEEAMLRASVAAIGSGLPDSLELVARRGERELARTRVATPGPARLSTASLRFTPREAAEGPVRVVLSIEGRDAEPDDDRRVLYLRISDEPAGVGLVSFSPGQESRFLLPVLERSLGLRVRGWLALPGGRFVRLGFGEEAGESTPEAAVRRALGDADLVVMHGLGDQAPAWARDLAGTAGRLLAFPASPSVDGLPFAPGPERPGDWYLAAEVPPSPVASVMAGLEPGDTPPLTALRTPELPAGYWSPLNARLGRRGPPRPVVAAGRAGGRRVAVALGEGYWRWAFAGGEGREAYDRLWSAVGGWLMQEADGTVAEAVRPLKRAAPRGVPIEWAVPAGADSARVVLRSTGDSVLTDTVVASRSGRATTAALAPGEYRYEVVALGAEGVRGRGSGELTVESYSPEFTRAPVSLEVAETAGGATPEGGTRVVPRGRPLHATAWPYVAIILLLCAEWALRRRWGLR